MNSKHPSLREKLDLLSSANGSLDRAAARDTLDTFFSRLNSGDIRAAEPAVNGGWHVNPWVKRGIMLAFRLGQREMVSHAGEAFFDRDTLPVRRFFMEDGIRMVPGGTAVRSGAYVAPGTVIMPPSYINTGAYVDANCMVDSHVLVGSCAQIGKRVHLSAGVQIGGVLEPAGAVPVVVEDDVFVGGGCGLFEGVIVRKRAVLAPGVNITGSTRIFDLVNKRVIARQGDHQLEIPENAVVVPGTRPVHSSYGKANGLHLSAPLIVKYRDARTDAATALTVELRGDG